jgi:hypothetical protein
MPVMRIAGWTVPSPMAALSGAPSGLSQQLPQCATWHLCAALEMHTAALSSAQCCAAARRAPQLRVVTRRGRTASPAAGTRAGSVVVLAAAVRHTAQCLVATPDSRVSRRLTVRCVACWTP